MSEPVYAVYGASGYGREVMPVARAQLLQLGLVGRLMFVDDGASESTLNGQRVLPYTDFLEMPASERYVAIAIANSKVRQTLAARCAQDGVRAWSLRAPNTVVMDEVAIGEGAILGPFVTLTSNIRIGRYFHANIYSYVAHDCVIGDFVTFAPSVQCNGNVVVEDHAYVGTSAILRQGEPERPLVIGAGAIIGMGAVVTKSVPPGSVVVGNPARPMAAP